MGRADTGEYHYHCPKCDEVVLYSHWLHCHKEGCVSPYRLKRLDSVESTHSAGSVKESIDDIGGAKNE